MTLVFSDGTMASHIEVDPAVGLVRLPGHRVAKDVDRTLNPGLVDERIRGGLVQGIDGALYEECLSSPGGQLHNATLADYLVQMVAETPDIPTAHVARPTRTSALGAKGAGEAGTAGAPGPR